MENCLRCKHFNLNTMKSCSAYPKNIPINILSGKDSHLRVNSDQIGKYIFNDTGLSLVERLKQNK